jgi:putative phosphoesterase
MRIGVISDSHSSSLPSELIKKLTNLNLDLIIHCGDYTDINVVQQLKGIVNFCGVAGNMDDLPIKKTLQEKEIIEVEGKKIGVFHGYGLFTDAKLENAFKGEKIDIFLHGHTHHLRNEKKRDIYYLNPGPFPKSMLIINIVKDREIEVEVVKL